MKKLSHTIIKNSATSARRSFMMLLIAVTAVMTAMIAMMMISMMKMFDARKTHGDAVGIDDVFKNYYDHEDGSDDDRGD